MKGEEAQCLRQRLAERSKSDLARNVGGRRRGRRYRFAQAFSSFTEELNSAWIAVVLVKIAAEFNSMDQSVELRNKKEQGYGNGDATQDAMPKFSALPYSHRSSWKI